MPAALLAALLFAISAICGYRSSKQIGGAEANFWRIALATLCLALWANIFGNGLFGAAFPLFVASGLFGIGLGDTGYFQALPRLGSRRAVLLTQCFIPVFAILIEWLWLGTKLAGVELLRLVYSVRGGATVQILHSSGTTFSSRRAAGQFRSSSSPTGTRSR